jgi:hypothetical protein
LKIIDYKNPPPILHSHFLQMRMILSAQLAQHGNGDARKNADNYRWYALSKYWSRKCDGRMFSASIDNSGRAFPDVFEDSSDSDEEVELGADS